MSKLDNEALKNIKILAIDMIDKAGSGHPGIVFSAAPILYALYRDHLSVLPNNSNWINRDRLVVSPGHASALLYSTLYHFDFNIDIDELKNFRTLNSLTPGHPEYKVTPGVDVSTGLLGEGIGNAVGMALAERYLRGIANIEKKDTKIIDYYTYCLCSDGDLEEGISYEALAFAAKQKLNKLILLYDCNKVTLDSTLDSTSTEDIEIRFEALGFNIIIVKNGSDYNEISHAIKQAKKADMPSIIIVKTIIGEDTSYAGTNKAHSTMLSTEEIMAIKKKYKITTEAFNISNEVLNYTRNIIPKRMEKTINNWNNEYQIIRNEENIGLNSILNLLEKNTFIIDFDDSKFKISDEYNEELRESNHKIMNFISPKNPFFLGGSADLSVSCKTNLDKSTINGDDNPVGKNILFGIREHAMGAILNGLALSNLKVFGSTFLAFADHIKPSIRMSAMMNLPVTYIFTHDSIYNASDGPTHIPVEQLSMLRTIPNFKTFRPADVNEIMGVWDYILKNNCATALILSREKRNKLKNTNAKYVKYGAYMIKKEKYHLDGVIIATGSEVETAINVANKLFERGIDLRVVSMPCMELFLQQNPKYEEQLLPNYVPIFSIEAGSTIMWNRFVSRPDFAFGINNYGLSGNGIDVAKYFKLSEDDITDKITNILKKDNTDDII